MPKFLRNLFDCRLTQLAASIIFMFTTGLPLVDILYHICFFGRIAFFSVCMIILWFFILTIISCIAFCITWMEIFEEKD